MMNRILNDSQCGTIVGSSLYQFAFCLPLDFAPWAIAQILQELPNDLDPDGRVHHQTNQRIQNFNHAFQEV